MSKIPERTNRYKQGLVDMINYIDSISDKPVRMMNIVEVGVWTGCASVIFAKRFREVICVDTWKQAGGDHLTKKYNMKEVEKIFDSRMSKYPGIIRKAKMDSKQAAFASLIEKMENIETYDVIYIDAIHTFEGSLKDMRDWKPIAKRFICGHDYEKRFPGVIKAVNKVFGKPLKVFKDTSWVVKIKQGGKE